MTETITDETHQQAVGCISCWTAGTLPREQLGRPHGIWWGEVCPDCGAMDRLLVTPPISLVIDVELPFERRSPYIHPRDAVEDYLARKMMLRNRVGGPR